MNFLQIILNYYNGEARHGLFGALVGGLFIVTGILLWRFASPMSLLKGLAWPLLGFGLLTAIGGASDSYVTHKAMPEKVRLYQQDKPAFFKQELVKVQKTHRSWFGIKLLWSVLSLAGLLLLIALKQPLWVGIGLGTLLLGGTLYLAETFSMRFNEQYYHDVKIAATQKATDALVQPTAIKDTVAVPSHPAKKKIVGFRMQQQVQSKERDSVLQIGKAQELWLTTAQTDTLTTIPVYTLADSAESTQNERHHQRKVLDYYHSDLIQANNISAKRCWVGKKFVKQEVQ